MVKTDGVKLMEIVTKKEVSQVYFKHGGYIYNAYVVLNFDITPILKQSDLGGIL